jgi:hypothetical protein
MGFPWDKWVPGVLNSLQMKQLLDDGFITTTGSRPDVGHSSMDLTLADEAYEMLKGSVKPSQKSYKWSLLQNSPKLHSLGSYRGFHLIWKATDRCSNASLTTQVPCAPFLSTPQPCPPIFSWFSDLR